MSSAGIFVVGWGLGSVLAFGLCVFHTQIHWNSGKLLVVDYLTPGFARVLGSTLLGHLVASTPVYAATFGACSVWPAMTEPAAVIVPIVVALLEWVWLVWKRKLLPFRWFRRYAVLRRLNRLDERTFRAVTVFNQKVNGLHESGLHDACGAGIPRLFERYLPSILWREAGEVPQAERQRVLGLKYLRFPHLQLRFLIAYLGHRRCRSELAQTTAAREVAIDVGELKSPALRFATWPVGAPSDERRKGSPRKDHEYTGPRRRRFDDATAARDLIGAKRSPPDPVTKRVYARGVWWRLTRPIVAVTAGGDLSSRSVWRWR